MKIISAGDRMQLYYLAKPAYGGWVSFTAHLALKHSLPVFKLGNRTEESKRPFGYGVDYQNTVAKDIDIRTPILITAIDKNYYEDLKNFPTGTFVVIHDPCEVTKKTSDLLLDQLKRFRIVTIRKSVQDYLQDTFHLKSLFLLHPFFPYEFTKTADPKKAVSISRIDFDKHTELLLEANQQLPKTKQIEIHGSLNRMYVYFKLKGLPFKESYKGQFPKSFEALNDILKEAKYCTDMSVIKHDGGGTQYTFLEAIYQGCALVINRKWVEGFETPFVDGKNCFVVGSGEELAYLLKKDPSVTSVLKEAKKILAPHIAVDWMARLKAYGKKGNKGKTRKSTHLSKALKSSKSSRGTKKQSRER